MTRRRAVVCLFLIVALSAAVRLVNLGYWQGYVFDEHYYASDASALITRGLASSTWRSGGFREQSHPLLGDETIAGGILVLGNDAWGWRLLSALAGVALIAMVYPLARRLLLGRSWAVMATGLAACDTLLIAQSRVAMLDVFVALWSIVCMYCAVRGARAPRPRLWLLLGGVSGGLAVASKWSGLFAILAALAVILLWRRRRGTSIGFSVLAFSVLPVAVYLLTYLPYFAAGHGLGQWVELQRGMATHGWMLRHPDPHSSAPASWFFDSNPIWYKWSFGRSGLRAFVAIGNPLLWWGAGVALVALAVTAARKRSRLLALPVVLVACLYCPWLVASRTTYLYYMVPVVPFLALALARALSLLRPRFAAAYAAATAVPMLAWLPLVVSLPVSWGYYHAVMLLSAWR